MSEINRGLLIVGTFITIIIFLFLLDGEGPHKTTPADAYERCMQLTDNFSAEACLKVSTGTTTPQ